MAHAPVTPTTEFGPDQRAALSLAGTIALPSPFPATARITIGVMPRTNTPGADPTPRFFLKLVEHLRDNYIVTRLASLKDLRAIRFRSAPTQPGQPWHWTLKTREDLFTDLDDARKLLESQAEEASRAGLPFSYETDLDSGAYGILYVPETAQILVRVEFGLLASEAAQAAAMTPDKTRTPCCPGILPSIVDGLPK